MSGSGEWDIKRIGSEDRLAAIRSSDGQRWCNATVAACLTYPSDFRQSLAEWVDLLDLLEDGIVQAQHTSSSRVAVAARVACDVEPNAIDFATAAERVRRRRAKEGPQS